MLVYMKLLNEKISLAANFDMEDPTYNAKYRALTAALYRAEQAMIEEERERLKAIK